MKDLLRRLGELKAQWTETAKVIRPIDNDGAAAYMECVEELDQIMRGDDGPIEKWSVNP